MINLNEISINEFEKTQLALLAAFKDFWIKRNIEDPALWPLSFQNNDWQQEFNNWVNSQEI